MTRKGLTVTMRSVLFTLLSLVLAMPGRTAELPAVQGYALLVGVNRYEKSQLTNLAYAENDMTALATVLREAGYHRVVLLTTARGSREPRYLPTGVNIRRELRGLLEDRRPNDTVLVALSGHGLEFADSDEPFFCPTDARVRERDTLLSLGEVYRQLHACPARVKVLLADTCRNDPLARVTRAALSEQVFAPRSGKGRKPPENVVALFACSPGESAYEAVKLEHGVFFHHVIEALQGQAAPPGADGVSLAALADHVQRKVADFVKEEFGARDRQRPELVGRYSGVLLLVPLRPPGAAGWEEAAARLLREGEFRQAERRLDAVIRADPRQARAFALRAEARARLGKPDLALADARQAVQLAPTLARGHFALGVAHARLRQDEQALAAYSEAIRLQPHYPAAYNNRGNVCYARKDYVRAVADHTRAIELDRGYALAWYNRGCAQLERKEAAEAVQDLTESLRLQPDSVDALDARARAWLLRADPRRALADCSRAVELAPDRAELYELRAQVHHRLGQPDRAEADRGQAAELKRTAAPQGGPSK